MAVIYGYTDDTAILESGKVMWHNSVVYQSTKDGTSTIHYEKGFKGLKGTNPLWTNTEADYQGQVPESSSGQGADIEDTAEKCDD